MEIKRERKLFKDVPIDGEFITGIYHYTGNTPKGEPAYLTLQKISRSKAEVIDSTPANWQPRQIGTIHHFGANRTVWEDVVIE